MLVGLLLQLVNTLTMKFHARLLAGSALVLPLLYLRGEPPGQSAGASAVWQAVVSLQESAVAIKAPLNSSPNYKAEKQVRLDAFRQAAQSAKDFRTQHPNDPNAPAAKKLEALAGIEGIGDDDKGQEIAALQTAADYRNDKTNFISDRFEVAHAVERLKVSQKLGGANWLSSPIEAETMVDRLREEFGEFPGVHGSYLTVAEAGTCDSAGDLARKLMSLPVEPEVRASAERIYRRATLIGTKVDLQLTLAGGKATRLSQLDGDHTVLYVWSPDRDPKGPSGLQPIKKRVPGDTRWIYLALGNYSPDAVDPKRRGTPVGTYCIEPSGWKSPIVETLQVTQLPYVYIFDAHGVLTGFGSVEEIPALLTRTATTLRNP